MKIEPLTPSRKTMLEAYIKCLVRAERRILLAAHVVTGAHYEAGFLPLRGKQITHIIAHMKRAGFGQHAEALQCLRLARSKFQAELSGLLWQ
jgi:hypothetical protein